MTSISKSAIPKFALDSINIIAKQLDSVSANLDMSGLEEFAPTAHQDITMTATLIVASASLDSNNPTDSVNPFAP